MQITQQHSQSSAFFAEDKKYLRFEDYLATHHIDPRRIPFTELSFQVCGYGYFQKYKNNMKMHFRQYLWQSIHACSELHTLKIIFNGFKVNSSKAERQQAQQLKMAQEHILLDIIQAVEEIARKKKFKVFHLHTTNLRNCTLKDLQKLFNLISVFGEDRCEEISIQLTDWQFEDGYPEYQQLVQIFTNFVADRPVNLSFKKFRLEISCWYMKEKEAYKFLSQSLNREEIVEKFKNQSKSAAKLQEQKKPAPVEGEAQNNQEGQEINVMEMAFPNLPQEQQEETMNSLLIYLDKFDQRYFQPKYPYKKSHEKYSQEDHEAFDAMLEEVKMHQGIVSKRLVKYPTQFVQQLRVDEFHRKMVEFLSNLLIKLNTLQEYHIDLRNWHGNFSMSGLKKILDTKVISNKQEFSLIRRSLINNKNQPQGVAEELGLKTIYTV